MYATSAAEDAWSAASGAAAQAALVNVAALDAFAQLLPGACVGQLTTELQAVLVGPHFCGARAGTAKHDVCIYRPWSRSSEIDLLIAAK